MKIGPAIPICLALLIVAVVAVLYMNVFLLLGFPDGFVSELDAAEAKLFTAFSWLSIGMSVWLIYLGVAARKQNVGKRLAASCILYCAVVASVLLVDQDFRAHLVDSAGG